MSPDAFWTLTPRMFVAFMAGRRKAAEARHDEALFHAWHVGLLSRPDLKPAKSFPPLRTILSGAPPAPPPRQTPEQMLTAMRAWAATAG